MIADRRVATEAHREAVHAKAISIVERCGWDFDLAADHARILAHLLPDSPVARDAAILVKRRAATVAGATV